MNRRGCDEIALPIWFAFDSRLFEFRPLKHGLSSSDERTDGAKRERFAREGQSYCDLGGFTIIVRMIR